MAVHVRVVRSLKSALLPHFAGGFSQPKMPSGPDDPIYEAFSAKVLDALGIEAPVTVVSFTQQVSSRHLRRPLVLLCSSQQARFDIAITTQ